MATYVLRFTVLKNLFCRINKIVSNYFLFYEKIEKKFLDFWVNRVETKSLTYKNSIANVAPQKFTIVIIRHRETQMSVLVPYLVHIWTNTAVLWMIVLPKVFAWASINYFLRHILKRVKIRGLIRSLSTMKRGVFHSQGGLLTDCKYIRLRGSCVKPVSFSSSVITQLML